MSEATIKKTPRAAIAGALSVDISPTFVSSPAKEFSEVIKPGMITHIEGNEIHPGGPVANTGMALPIFGVEPLFVAKVGNDAFGSLLTSVLASVGGPESVEGISVDSSIYTAYSIILAPAGLDRAILQNPGANDYFSEQDVDYGKMLDCSLFHFGHPSSMKNMYENDGEQLVNIMKKARGMGMVTSFDLCAVDPDTDAGKADWKKILQRVLPYVDFFLPSYGELRDIIAPGEDPEPAYLTFESLALGATNIFLKLGKEGAYFRNSDGTVFRDIEERLGFERGSMESWEDRIGTIEAKLVPAENVVSGLGAGDTTISAYIAAMLRGYDFDNTIDLAVTEGALCVTAASAIGGLKPFEEL